MVIYIHDGEPVVFKDLCLHRGAKLSGGIVDDNGAIQCPYHGWKFDSLGKCILIPSMNAKQKYQILVFGEVQSKNSLWSFG